MQQDARIRLNEHGQVLSADGSFLDISFCFMHHNVTRQGTSITETLRFVVSIGQQSIHEETITIEPMYFHNLVNLPPERARRDLRLLTIAEEILPA